MHFIFVINPGSTSTKIALYQDEKQIWSETIEYSKDQLKSCHTVLDQIDIRRSDISRFISLKGLDLKSLTAVVGRGGPFKPLESGTYRVDEKVIADIRGGHVQANHISNIGAILAFDLASELHIPAYFVDPVSVDEFLPHARISGLPEIERKSLVHALNVKATARRAANDMGRPLENLNLIVAHLGGGISICPVANGRIIDVNNANEGGPFSPERSGSLPVYSLVELCFSGKYSLQEMLKKIAGKGGLVAHLGTNEIRDVENRIEKGDKEAELVFRAMAYQISKEIGAMSTVLHGNVDAILITGGMAHSERLTGWIKERVLKIAPVCIYPGENEMEALALGALRVLNGEEEEKQY